MFDMSKMFPGMPDMTAVGEDVTKAVSYLERMAVALEGIRNILADEFNYSGRVPEAYFDNLTPEQATDINPFLISDGAGASVEADRG